ncbi:Adenylate and Guanylate cyclase catalytic domain-containing protein [Mucilaginibacter sp. OK268]|uniref:adenylate/guanylate cyclase domain-containing protein n=1 Tax=Mucilaginibacter sp. OK268 TaxID=1881048 RepID=UPI00088B6CDA|nr:adenylate/guanylate cyclase domain-containing protein [Mucilaginibacter sp. OK268]SDP86396.1 Adenylate and Guanylate cyclase catalytic domain-containing protein [Mucilaginibacter sp. OK268]
MANLDAIKAWNNSYSKTSPITEKWNVDNNLNEAFDPDRIKKGFDLDIANLGPWYAGYFEMGLPANVALLFIDVCGFSTRFQDLDGEEIAEYFDKYYNEIIPIVYEFGGEIDKIIGDGIIAVFGPPFTTASHRHHIKQASHCAKRIVRKTKGTDFSSKVAFHAGTINYYQNKTGLYNEFTMIGKPITELFRLESIAEDECVNYYDDTDIRDYYLSIMQEPAPADAPKSLAAWSHYSKPVTGVKGVDYKKFFRIEYNYK